MQTERDELGYSAYAKQINSRTCFIIAKNIFQIHSAKIVPAWFPKTVTTKLFEDETLLKTSKEPACLLCEDKWDNLALLLFHYFFLHPDTLVVLCSANVGGSSVACLNVIKSSQLKHAFHTLETLEGLENTLAARVQWLRIILERMTFMCPNDSLKVVSLFEAQGVPYISSDYEYWLYKDPQRKHKQLMEHLKKIDNFVLNTEIGEFMRSWNFFVMSFKDRLLASNFFFTNFLNSAHEMYYLLWIYLETHFAVISRFEDEIKNHIFLMFVHTLLSTDDFFSLIDKVNSIVQN